MLEKIKKNLKTYLGYLGSLLAVLGIIYLAIRMSSYAEQISLSEYGAQQFFIVVGLAFLYGFCGLFMAFAWQKLLNEYSLEVPRKWIVFIYGKTQIMKYVPGNIFHLAGRQAEGMRIGLAAKPLAKTTMWELLIQSSAALPFVAAIFLFRINVNPFIIGLSCVALFTILAFVWTKIGSANFAACFSIHSLFHLCAGLIFFLLVISFATSLKSGTTLFYLPAAYIVAWLIGLITPGAPAGLGVREVVLIFLLKGHLAENDIIILTTLSRVVTGAGDLIYFGLSYLGQKTSYFGWNITEDGR